MKGLPNILKLLNKKRTIMFFPNIPNISPDVASEKLKQNNGFIVIDVREDNEVRFVNLMNLYPEKVFHIKLGEIISRINEIPKQKEVGILCHHGNRSARVTAYLKNQGFENVVNIQGGIDQWAKTVDKDLPLY